MTFRDRSMAPPYFPTGRLTWPCPVLPDIFPACLERKADWTRGPVSSPLLSPPPSPLRLAKSVRRKGGEDQGGVCLAIVVVCRLNGKKRFRTGRLTQGRKGGRRGERGSLRPSCVALNRPRERERREEEKRGGQPLSPPSSSHLPPPPTFHPLPDPLDRDARTLLAALDICRSARATHVISPAPPFTFRSDRLSRAPLVDILHEFGLGWAGLPTS